MNHQSQQLSDQNTNNMPTIILGSTSIFRKALLNKLNLSFVQDKPNIDETPIANEQPEAMVQRLAKQKAAVFTQKYPEHIIISSDQTAVFNNQALGKPLNREKAIEQLSNFSGNQVDFYTAMVVINTSTDEQYEHCDTTTVFFRELSEEVITHYIDIEQPFNCAGSFKSEGLGITLFKKIESQDPNALVGLPLIALTDIFYKMGYPLPLEANSQKTKKSI